MAKRRLQVGELQIPGLRPTASPVDTYSSPAAESSLSRLAGGLAKFNKNLTGLSDALSTKYMEEQKSLGEAAAREFANQGLTMGDLQREGKIPASQNPWYMASFNEQMGRVTADRWSEDLTAQMGTDKVLEKSTSMKDFDAYWSEKRDSWMKENGAQGWDKYFTQGFGGRADAYQHQARMEHAQRIEKNVKSMSQELQFSETNKFARGHAADMTPQEMAAAIKEHINDPAVKLGRLQAEVDVTAVRALQAAAMDDEDHGEKILETLRYLTGENGMVLGDTSYGSEVLTETQEKLGELVYRLNNRAWEGQQREREKRTRVVLQDGLKLLQQDRHADLTPLLTKIKDDPEAVSQLVQLQRQANSLSNVTDESVKNQLHSGIWSPEEGQEPVSEKSIIRALNAKSLTSDDSIDLINQLERARAARTKDGGTIYKDSNFMAIEDTLPRRFADSAGMTPAFAGDRITNSIAMFRERWANLAGSGQMETMSDQQKLEWLTKTADAVVQLQRTVEGDDSGFLFTMDPAPAPVFPGGDDIQGRLPKNLVIPAGDIMNALNGNGVSKGIENMINTLGLHDEQEILQFLQSQHALIPQAKAKKLDAEQRKDAADKAKSDTTEKKE